MLKSTTTSTFQPLEGNGRNALTLILLVAVCVVSGALGFNKDKDSFLKYGTTDTSVYYTISHGCTKDEYSEESIFATVSDYGLSSDRNSFLIAHQVYRSSPYLAACSISNLLAIDVNYTIYTFNTLGLLTIILFFASTLQKNVLTVALALWISVAFSFKMNLAVPYLLNYTMFVAFALIGLKKYDDDRYLISLLFITLGLLCRQSMMIISLAIVIDTFVRRKSFARVVFGLAQFTISFFLYLYITNYVTKLGFTNVTTMSVAGFLLDNSADDFILLGIMVAKLLVSLTPILFFIYSFRPRLTYNLYTLAGVGLLIQPLLGLRFTGLSISIVACLAVPFLIYGILKEVRYIYISQRMLLILGTSLLFSFHPSWDALARFSQVYFGVTYLHTSSLSIILLLIVYFRTKAPVNENCIIYKY